MSYKNKLNNYQGDCLVELGKYKYFSDYIKEFSTTISGKGIDIGAGPGGYNSQFFKHCSIDGCDADSDVVSTLPDVYENKFVFRLGEDLLPYENRSLDFVVCSCVIQHLNSFNDLVKGIEEISLVLKKEGKFYLMFKAGTNDTLLTHYNSYYKEDRTFRVYNPLNIEEVCLNNGLKLIYNERLIDENWIPYCCMVFILI